MIRLLRMLFPQGCGNTHWWDQAVCYRCQTPRVELVTVDHNGDVQEMACRDEHSKPWGTWRTIRLSPAVEAGTWRRVERAVARTLAEEVSAR